MTTQNGKNTKSENKESYNIQVIRLSKLTLKQNFRPQINLKRAKKDQKGSKGFQRLRIKSQKTKRLQNESYQSI